MKEKLSTSFLGDLNAVINEVYVPPLGEGEFTITSVAESKEIGYTAAIRIVKAMLQAGTIELVGMRDVGGHKAKAYRIIKKGK